MEDLEAQVPSPTHHTTRWIPSTCPCRWPKALALENFSREAPASEEQEHYEQESRDWRRGGVTKNKNLHSGWNKGPAASQALSPPFGNQALPPQSDIWAQTLTLGCLVHILTFPLFTCESLDKFTSSLGPNFLVWKIGIIHLYKFISRMKIDKIENHWIRNTKES